MTTQVRLAQEMGAEVVKTVATAAIREAKNRDKVVEEIEEIAGVEVDVLDEEEEGRFAFIGATKSLSHPVEGKVAVVDVGGGSSEVIYGTMSDGVTEVKSFKIGSGSLTEDHLESDPPSAAEIRGLRDHIADFFEEVELEQPDQAVAVGGSATSLRTLVGAVLEYETLERAVRVLSSDEIYEVAKRFELDSAPRQAAARRRPAAREVLRHARPAAADRQGRPARGDHPHAAERQRERIAPALRLAGRELRAVAFALSVAKAQPIPDLTRRRPVRGGGRQDRFASGARELAEHAQGVLDTGDIERVHDMRVATRRLRAALEIFEPCFPAKAYGQALTEVKRLADALGERRDRDVAIAALHSFNDQMAAPDRRGVGSLIEQLRGEQERRTRAWRHWSPRRA